MSKSRSILIAGDLLALALITVIGFATHGEIGISFLPRMLTTFIPLMMAWFLFSPWFGLFDPQTAANLKQIWRAPLAMFLAAPLAGVLRGFLLNALVLPVFVFVLGLFSALGMSIWRAVYLWLFRNAD